jgi:hypothetical protein
MQVFCQKNAKKITFVYKKTIPLDFHREGLDDLMSTDGDYLLSASACLVSGASSP